jgi:hypothetical protein
VGAVVAFVWLPARAPEGLDVDDPVVAIDATLSAEAAHAATQD